MDSTQVNCHSDVECNESDEEIADFAMEIESTNSQVKENGIEDYQYEILTTDQVMNLMTDLIRDVNSVVEIPATTTRLLLSHFNWDKQKLLEKYYDDDQEKLFEEAHVMNPFKKCTNSNANLSPQNAITESSKVVENCGVCLTTIPISKMDGLECGHRFCLECWNDYLITKIMKESIGEAISCPAHSCGIYVDDESVMRLCTDAIVKRKYQRLIVKSFVECSMLLRWCPALNCNYAVKVQYKEAKSITCLCNHTFCFDCGEDWHEPITCALLRKWNKRYYEDSKNTDWMANNTKECPRCDTTIHKDGGCNAVVCTKCRLKFCWSCFHRVTSRNDDHDDFCTRYNPANARMTCPSRRALGRYMFYHHKFMNHMHSLKFERELYDKVKNNMEQKQQQNVSWTDLLKKAVDILCSCRRILMYTYAFAFCIKKNNHSAIFEDNQRDLEIAVEILSGYLERDIATENVMEIQGAVQDKYRYCEARRKLLLEYIVEGYSKNWWEYND